MNTDSSFSYRERLLITPLLPGQTKQFFHARMESAMALKEDETGKIQFTPFPREAQEILRSHNATRVLIQVGTSSSHSFGHNPLDSVEPWHNLDQQRLDLGPSGVSVRATFQISSKDQARAHWEEVLHELVDQRILLAPLFSISVRRLHRHWISWTDEQDANLQHFQLILPMEGAALSSEGMHALVTTFSPCHNHSGIFSWNTPTVLSEFFLKRQSAERHSWWIQIERDTNALLGTTLTRITKGMQFQPHVDSKNKTTVKFADLFPSSKRQRSCPFVESTSLETLVPFQSDETKHDGSSFTSRGFSAESWKEPFIALLPNDTPKPASHWSVQQTLQRPRGVSYSGRFITQVTVHPTQDCPTSVELQWFLPPIVQPTWQSFQVIHEDSQEQIERKLDWRMDLQGSITTIDPVTGRSSHQLGFDEGTIYFRIPQWNVTGGSGQQALTISLDYRPAFLSFENFPGDANRGVEIPPAVATFNQGCGRPSKPIQLYSNSLLLLPPVPDMSMPFNVLSMTCSLYAFVIGSLLNLMIRKTSERVRGTYDPSTIKPSKFKVVIGKLKDKLTALKGKLRKSDEKEELKTIPDGDHKTGEASEDANKDEPAYEEDKQADKEKEE